tara:strand:+ start:65 stop:340 length:276 start_codon:yes stop_codon:yes gene_type:complete
LFDSNANIPRNGRVSVPTSKMPTGQMPHPDIFLTIRLAFIYRYLRPPMQMLFSDESVVFGETDFWAQNFLHLGQKLKKTASAVRRRGEAGH